MEHRVYKDIKRDESIVGLSEAIKRAWDWISQRFINKTIDKWRISGKYTRLSPLLKCSVRGEKKDTPPPNILYVSMLCHIVTNTD